MTRSVTKIVLKMSPMNPKMKEKNPNRCRAAYSRRGRLATRMDDRGRGGGEPGGGNAVLGGAPGRGAALGWAAWREASSGTDFSRSVSPPPPAAEDFGDGATFEAPAASARATTRVGGGALVDFRDAASVGMFVAALDDLP